MIRYIGNRLIYLIPIVFFMSVIVFSFMHLIPGDPVDYMLGFEAGPEAKAALRKELGLDRSILVQYLRWAGKLLQGDFGESVVSRKAVLSTILEKFPATLLLSFAATFISLLIALIAGTIASARRGSLIDLFVLILALLWVSIPSFWLGIMLIIFFALHFPIFPSMGYVNPLDDLPRSLHHMILPAFTLGATMAGAVTRMTRSEMIEQLSKDYITTAWAKGLSRKRVIYKHALKNALIPVVTFSGLQLGTLLGGAVVVEEIFAWPGLGRLAIQSIYARDYPMVQGIVLFMSLIFVLINLLMDVSYAFLNPQIRLGRKRD